MATKKTKRKVVRKTTRSTRNRILEMLKRGPCTTKELAEDLGCSRSAVSFYLNRRMGRDVEAVGRDGQYKLWRLKRNGRPSGPILTEVQLVQEVSRSGTERLLEKVASMSEDQVRLALRLLDRDD